MLLAEIILDVAGEDVPCGADAFLEHQAAEGDDGYFGCAAADVDDHASLGLEHLEAYTECGGHGFVNEEDVTASGVLGGVAHGPDLHFGGTGRDAYDHLEVGGEEAAVLAVDLLDEALYHHFRGVEVGDHAVPQRAYGLDARIAAFVHQLGLLADGDALAGIVVDSHYAGFVQHYVVVLVDDGVGRSEVYCEFLVEKRKCHFSYLWFK